MNLKENALGGAQTHELTFTRLEDNLIRHRGDRPIYVYVCYRCLPFRLATPPGFHVTRIPKGNLVYI